MKIVSLSICCLILFIRCSSEQAEAEEVVPPVATLPYFNDSDFTPIWLSDEIVNVDTLHKIHNFSLVNQNGDKVTNKMFEGKIYVANFFFTSCPGICPKLTNHFEKLQEEFKTEEDFLLLSHSVMPSTDSVAVLKKYAERNNVDDTKWHLVTGSENEIKDLARFSYFSDDQFKKNGDEEGVVHTENFVLVDKDGHIRGVYSGTLEFDVNRLIKHIKILQQEE